MEIEREDPETNDSYPLIKAPHQRSFGKTYPLFFKDNEPLIVIGPNCKLNLRM